MTFTLTIEMDTAAFVERPFDELRRLCKLAVVKLAVAGLESGGSGTLLDTNGHTVGRYEVTP